MRRALCFLSALALGGCAGIAITPISPDSAATAHTAKSSVNGYIVYHPIVIVEVSEKEVCIAKGADGKCTNSELRCATGAPFLLPDYAKPYVIEIKSGFGKAGSEVEILDGWRLGKAKDTSDNTSILGLIEKFVEAKILTVDPKKRTPKCDKAGLYSVTIENGAVKLAPLTYY